MSEQTRLEKIKAFFSETPELKDLEVVEKVAEVKEKFEEVALLSGDLVNVEPALEVGATITATAEDGTIVPLPVGEYELGDNRIIVVEVDGVIADIMNPVAEEETVEEEEMADDTKTAEAERQAKKVIESIVKEHVFKAVEEIKSTYEKEMKFLHDELNTQKEMFNELKEVTGLAVEEFGKTPTKEPIKENKNSFGKKETKSVFDKFLNK
jgi:hypothetical protein